MTNNFNEIENDLLRTWNRCETIANLSEKNAEEAQNYFDQFDEKEQMKIKILLLAVSANGKEAIKKKVMEEVYGQDDKDAEANSEA